jgi:hypothetical protein
MLGKIVTITLLAFSSAALAQQQQCQLECTRVVNRETKVTRSCYDLDAAQCALVADLGSRIEPCSAKDS